LHSLLKCNAVALLALSQVGVQLLAIRLLLDRCGLETGNLVSKLPDASLELGRGRRLTWQLHGLDRPGSFWAAEGA
jgi:hypothetical protein